MENHQSSGGTVTIDRNTARTLPKIQPRPGAGLKSFALSSIPRCRWNVLDLITVVARRSTPAYLFCDVNMHAAEVLRQRYANKGLKVTVTAILLKAIAIAQLSHPQSRSFRLPQGNLVTPPVPVAGFTVERTVEGIPAVFFGTICDVANKPLAQIADELKAYSVKEIASVPQLRRESLFRHAPWLVRRFFLWLALRIPALRGRINSATFGLSSLGKFGLNSLLAPCVSSCIFGVGSVELKPIFFDGEVQIKPMMRLSLSVDTSVLSMYSAARVLSEVKRLLETGLDGHILE